MPRRTNGEANRIMKIKAFLSSQAQGIAQKQTYKIDVAALLGEIELITTAKRVLITDLVAFAHVATAIAEAA